ncbi:glycosyltransferase family 9 protein [Kordiimonas gwangyangensis]|uniref:glycosyltransferase family 9 protein n=2 Tax=Kordiimonas gwangyangensis TaxID=288022 RepID=UPI00138AD352|nr:glycosyltransferase family 9 protein [Kordiimonas gwangyangensis]
MSVSAGGRFWLTDPVPGIDKEYYFSHHRATVAAHIATFLTGAKVSDTPALQGGDRSQAVIAKWLGEEGLADHAVVVVHMGAGQKIREWGVSNFRTALLKACKEQREMVAVVAVDDPNTGASELVEDIRSAGLRASLWRGSLPDLKALLVSSSVLLCNDSGPMHVAAACGCNVVAIFGPGSLEMFSPIGDGISEAIFHSPMPCRPCYDRCIHQSPICLEAVTPIKVALALRRALGAN